MKNDSRAVMFTSRMVQIDSSNPGYGEKNMERFLCSFFEKLDTDIVMVQKGRVAEGRNNLMASIKGDPSEPELVLICHMDTVPEGDGWDADPLSGRIMDDKVYGRGSCDMKSGLACALSAFADAAARAKAGGRPGRTLKLIATVDEEGDMTGVEQAIRSGWVSKNSLVLDMEPTNGEIQMAHKGRTWFEIHVLGITAHASTPWEGADAIAAMAEVISSIRNDFAGLPTHEELGISTVTFGQILGGCQPYVVSDECMVTVDMRLVPPTRSEQAEEIVKKALRRAANRVPKISGFYRMTGNRPCIERNDASPLLAALQTCCEKVTGQEAKIGVFNGYTDSAVIAGTLNNHNCMSYGPGDLKVAHKPNEYVMIKDIIRCENVLRELIIQLLFP